MTMYDINAKVKIIPKMRSEPNARSSVPVGSVS